MGSIFPRGRKLWMKYKDASGKWINERTGYDVGQEKAARGVLARVEDRVAAGDDPASGPLTLDGYSKRWIKERQDRKVPNVVEDEARLRLHILPVLGVLPMAELRPRHVRDLMRRLQAPEANRAPRTVRNIYATLRKLCNDAVVDEVIDSTPCKVKRGDLPKNIDKDPEWRETAYFTREEVEQLIADARVPMVRRVYYAMQALAGPRVSSGLARRWKHYDPAAKPLGKLALVTKYSTRRKREELRTKSGASIYVPVHPTLAALLTEWKQSGWDAHMGRKPTDEDLIIPGDEQGGFWSADRARTAFHRDLKTLGLRRRRQHDLRRTFVSLARAAGAREDVVEWMSHGPRGDIISMYTSLPWELLCQELVKLDVRHDRELVVAMRASANAERLVHSMVQPLRVISVVAEAGGSAQESNLPESFITTHVGFEETKSKQGVTASSSVSLGNSASFAYAAAPPSTVKTGQSAFVCTKCTKAAGAPSDPSKWLEMARFSFVPPRARPS